MFFPFREHQRNRDCFPVGGNSDRAVWEEIQFLRAACLLDSVRELPRSQYVARFQIISAQFSSSVRTSRNQRSGASTRGVHFDVASIGRPRYSQINVANLLEVSRIQHQQSAFLIDDELCSSIGIPDEMLIGMQPARIV